jgi:hypothetical protein
MLQAACKLYDIMWGKNLDDLLQDVPNTNDLKYLPKASVDDMQLKALGYREDVLLIRDEYLILFDELVIKSEHGCKGVVVLGQPGIGA